jgi:hypothetical protein
VKVWTIHTVKDGNWWWVLVNTMMKIQVSYERCQNYKCIAFIQYNQNTFLINYNPDANTNVKSVHDNQKQDFINCFAVLSMLLISSYRYGTPVDGLGSVPPQIILHRSVRSARLSVAPCISKTPYI